MKKKVIFITGIFLISLLCLFYLSSISIQFYRKNQFLHNLEKTAEEKIDNSGLEYSYFVKNLRFPRLKLSSNKFKQFPAASLIKLPILAVALEAIKEEKKFLEEKIVISKKDITGGSGKLKAMSLPHTLSFRELLEFMITASDNTATNKVITLLGFDYINKGFKRLGLEGTSLVRRMMDFSKRNKGVENYTSAYDIAYLLEQIYHKKLVDEELSALALSFLEKQKVGDRLPRYLPKEVVVAHKTGLERGVVHDAGIIFTPKGDYILCVLLKKVKSYKKAKKLIAEVSLLAYNLYQ